MDMKIYVVGYSLIGEPPWLLDSVLGATSSSVQDVKAMAENEAKRMIAINFFMAVSDFG